MHPGFQISWVTVSWFRSQVIQFWYLPSCEESTRLANIVSFMCSIWLINTNVITILGGHTEVLSSSTWAVNCANDTDENTNTWMYTKVHNTPATHRDRKTTSQQVAHVDPSVQTEGFQAAGLDDICLRSYLIGFSKWQQYRGPVTG